MAESTCSVASPPNRPFTGMRRHRDSGNVRHRRPIGYSKVVNGIAKALASVSTSEQELVAILYGFDGQSRTPEEIARLCRRSLPEIDQTAKRVMRRMRHPVGNPPLLLRCTTAIAASSRFTTFLRHGVSGDRDDTKGALGFPRHG